ncbi:DJ-1/PfpI family protein [candidate division WOR-3 bacterium]|nr:DJ-1/PfpI family protein [candidate division WOR-3 bacterium]
MKRNFRILTLALIFSALTAEPLLPDNVKALFLMPEYYGANYNLIRNSIEEMGWEIVLCAVDDTVAACTWSTSLGGYPIPVDLTTAEITDVSEYDCLLIMPASYWISDPYGEIIDDSVSILLIQEAFSDSIPVAAWCAGVRVMAVAGIISGKDVTGHSSFSHEYTAAGANYLGPDLPPVVDGNIITCTRGQYYMLQAVIALSRMTEKYMQY